MSTINAAGSKPNELIWLWISKHYFVLNMLYNMYYAVMKLCETTKSHVLASYFNGA